MVITLSNPKPLHIYPAATILWGPRAEGIGTLIALVILGIGLAGFAVGNLFYTGLWYDESVQFWISRGLSPFAPPLSDPGSLLDVGKYNRLFNLDPGGFSLLLFFWSAVGTDIAWLRLLPFLFFILGLGCFGLLVYSWTRSRLISLLCISMLFWFDLILYHSVEVRAYSMEFAGTMLILYLTRIALLRLSRRTFFILGLVAALFMTSVS